MCDDSVERTPVQEKTNSNQGIVRRELIMGIGNTWPVTGLVYSFSKKNKLTTQPTWIEKEEDRGTALQRLTTTGGENQGLVAKKLS